MTLSKSTRTSPQNGVAGIKNNSCNLADPPPPTDPYVLCGCSLTAVHFRTKIDYVALRYCLYCQTLSEVYIKIHISILKRPVYYTTK